ncbi:hypothetical protein K402DRAFT_394976 [Aulographum hederae CBS 113979]|uniref:Hyaluronan/mRNA-binding protein domain-containing protein n=1 Tax=Aulographum hederae CBS 113979 TaxID=1176131 RepID=A0A6G1GX19_9PEZI|nr:hypothetical protein K402DRAFT_394976 [Aulographum hederae CBS 113979]
MSAVASKNLYELLGNDLELDPNREPDPPVKVIDKTAPRAGKRNAGPEPPAASATVVPGGVRGGRQDNASGNDGAFRDRGAGSYNNRNKPTDERMRGDGERGRGRGRGGRGRGRGGFPGDRQSHSGRAEHEKQAAHGWGGQTGGDEWADEKAGEAIAKEEEKSGFDTTVPPPVDAEGEVWKPDTSAPAENDGFTADAPEPEPEDKSKSYADYLAEQAQKKLELAAEALNLRKPNEGASKKLPEGKAIAKEDAEDFFAGSGPKAKRERQKKEGKTFLELDGVKMREEARDFGGRGGRGRGGPRGGRGGDRGGRGRGRGGDDRPPRGGGFRGGAAPPNANLRIDDSSAFPTLGGSK